MKITKTALPGLFLTVTLFTWRVSAATPAAPLAGEHDPAKAIPWTEVGATAGAQYSGDGLTVIPTEQGARLRCVFQRLDGEATPDGLWLTSTVSNAPAARFRLAATTLRRDGAEDWFSPFPSHFPLPTQGTVTAAEKLVRFARPGLVEEYSVSMDGVRQDFVVLEKPTNPLTPAPSPSNGERVPFRAGEGALRLEFDVAGASVESRPDGARLVLEGSGRKIAYTRLRATDATGRELPARMEISPVAAEVTRLKLTGDGRSHSATPEHGTRCGTEVDQSLLTSAATGARLAVVVDDADAIYPVRIDPTFSDESWISMGGLPGANGTVNAAAVDGLGNLYLGGSFTAVGSAIATNVAKWNGSSWSALGSGLNNPVWALAVSGSDLYVGGAFTMAGGSEAKYVAKWDGSNWSALGSGVNYYVQALAVSGSDLFVGGEFMMAGGSEARFVAKWNGSNWSALGSGVISKVNALAVSGSNLYVGGVFTNAGGIAANGIAKWNGSGWSALGSGVGAVFPKSPYVYALAVAGSNLYAGGGFTTAGGSEANRIAKWNGNNWSALGSGLNNNVYALAVAGNALYVGGYFTNAGNSAANCVAKWNGSSWSALGEGLNNGVLALVVSGSDLYVGGYFTTAGGSPASCVAKWNGSSWSALGSGMGGFDPYPSVYALATSGSNLYAGGYFATAGGSPANRIAKWNGSTWSALGSGLNSSVYALAVAGSNLYAGGYFTTAGGSPVNGIAKWNGTSWSTLGSGVGGAAPYPYVHALAVAGNSLYAGGYFTTAGGSPANRIAKWNGSTWSALGSGLNSNVWALAVSGSNLYVGGAFTMAGGSGANRVAKWDGSTWSALGSGLNSNVWALAVSGSDLYVGGEFWAAGGKVSTYVAKVIAPLQITYANANLALTWGGGWILQSKPVLDGNPAGWQDVAGAASPYPVPVPLGTQSYYRLREP